MKQIIIEPNRSIIPTEYHKTKEYKFIVESPTVPVIEGLLKQIPETIEGLCGISLTDILFDNGDTLKGSTSDFFISVSDGKLIQF